MLTVSGIKNRLKVVVDPELREVRRVIELAETTTRISSFATECDQIFIDRLNSCPNALKMRFWENHFEWNDLKKYPEIYGHILDFGCGAGHSDIFLARNGYMIHGVDLSQVGIAIAACLKSKESIEVRERVSFEVTDVSLANNNQILFDSAWSTHVFEHISDPAPIFNGLKSWLKPAAYMLISVPLGYAYNDPGHVNYFHNSDDIKHFLSPHVQIVKIDISQENQVIRVLCTLNQQSD